MVNYVQQAKYAQPHVLPKLLTTKLASIPFVADKKFSFFYKSSYANDEYSRIEKVFSPYSKTFLHKYIRRDFESCPSKLAILRYIGNRLFPIDYVYLSTKLLSPVNRLLSYFFWPGLDVSEFLAFPEYSMVVMYKKLVIGCAFMTPDTSYITYLLVHPDWEKADIATFMLYHLIQVS